MRCPHRYTVYRRKTDTPVIYGGTARECAAAMGISVNSFYTIFTELSKGRTGSGRKWEIIRGDPESVIGWVRRMNSYQYYKDPCARCNRNIPLRDMNKIMFCKSHMVNSPARKLCYVCDECFAAMLDFLEVPEPEEKDRPYTLPRWCRKCYTSVGKRARYCPHCGADLDEQKEEHHG